MYGIEIFLIYVYTKETKGIINKNNIVVRELARPVRRRVNSQRDDKGRSFLF